ncbi:SpaA isopeptide-forming pilin-related protein [Listeria marthii]|uniref:SpaA isopeptide-forming pilin-related protein n=1 Tax=Listeria marthii TaxID=529731 RepID=UPI0016282F14|nr:SpaA isopeptide-forming pilin-related protein [Listeria marthii]MBC2011659.1 hypothetical protein [Listeria marthii]MBC2060907.1 hypothetical protein [Listeria marthii]
MSKYVKQLSNSANLKIEKIGNKLKLTATKDLKESGTIKYSIADSNSVGQSFVQAKLNEKKAAIFKLSNAKLKFEYGNKIKEVITDSNGFAKMNDLTQGTTVVISESAIPDSFFNQG